MLIVQKFGGTSVADADKIARAADAAVEVYRSGAKVVTVVSAQGDATDVLLQKAREIAPLLKADERELDALLATGEQVSAALLALELEKRGVPAVSLTGWQLGIRTDARHGDARIEGIDTARLRAELDAGRAGVAAGFQGVDAAGAVTTLGRGGSDTTAAALAAALKADLCRIYTDVDGVYTADPRKVPEAKKLDAVAWREMLRLAELGSQVLHDRSVALAMEHGVVLEVRSAERRAAPGTFVGPAAPRAYTGVTRSGGRVSLVGAAVGDDTASAVETRIRAALTRQGIPVSSTAQGAYSLTAVVPEEQAEAAVRAVHAEFF